MSKIWVLVFVLITPSAFAPNEAGGGDWVANRFRARAFDALSVFCQDSEKPQAAVNVDGVVALENTISNTPIRTELSDIPDFIQIRIDPKTGSYVWLNRTRWVEFLNLELDAYREIAGVYLKLAGNNPALAEKLDVRRLLPKHLHAKKPVDKPLVFRDGAIAWTLFTDLKSHPEAQAHCLDLNKQEKYASIAQWSLPSQTEAAGSLEAIRKGLGAGIALRPAHYAPWTLDGGFFDVFTAKQTPADDLSHGVLCRGI